MAIDEARSDFRAPPSRSRLTPFWFWNHWLENEELRWQILEMNAKGVGGFIMHARHGLLTPYLSDRWFNGIGAAVDQASKLGMKAYLYDENNWPSGPADGKVLEQNPEFRESGVKVSWRLKVRGPTHIEEKVDLLDGLVTVLAVPLDEADLTVFPERVVDLHRHVNGDLLSCDVAEGEWLLLAFARKSFIGTFFGSYLDVLNRDAVAKFVESTHRQYAERFRDHFGRTVLGIFTDEPSCNHNADDCIPWTPTLPEEFERRKRYDLKKALPALFMEMGATTAKVRCDFSEVVAELYKGAFFKQIYDCCEEFGLASVGHVLYEGELYQQVKHERDFFRTVEFMHYAGVDYLTETTWPRPDDRLNNLVGPKLASSAGHHYQKPIVMSEAFGLASQWAISLRTLKCLADWQIVLGVNLIMPHAFYYSIQGFRKWECPPDQFYRAPFWPQYRTFADYAARLCSLFRDGTHVASAAVLYPARSLWAAIDPGSNTRVQRLVTDFNKASSSLARAHFDFDYISEELLWSSDVSEGTLKVRDGNGDLVEAYPSLVIPSAPVISRKTAEKLVRLLQAGGKILFTGETPVQSAEAGVDPELEAHMAELLGPLREKAAEGKPELAVEKWMHPGGGVVAWMRGLDGASEERIEMAVAQALEEMIPTDVSVTDEHGPARDIIHLHYVRGGRHYLFLVNTSREKTYSARIRMAVQGQPELWDAETGKCTPILVYESHTDETVMPLRFKPVQSYVICIEPGKPSAPHVEETTLAVVKVEPGRVEGFARNGGEHYAIACIGDETSRLSVTVAEPPPHVELSEPWAFRTERMNALPLRNWHYRIEARVQSRDSATCFHVYETRFMATEKPLEARLLLDGLVTDKVWRRTANVDVKVYVNGTQVEEFEEGSYLDHLVLEADVTSLLREGENHVSIRTEGHLYEIPSLAHQPILAGRFSLSKRRDVWNLAPERTSLSRGSWTEQGYPYYSGVGVYENSFHLTDTYEGCRLTLSLEKVADLAEIIVNGKAIAVRAWEPFEAELTPHVKRGENTLTIKVANSMQNLLVEPKPSGLLGKARILAERQVTLQY